MEEVLHRACGIAVEAARFAGTLIRERFGGPFGPGRRAISATW